jgi:crotonobetainyl-CoA:carnitine CoA-transferase CaiB-like acyl-CoA transferase
MLADFGADVIRAERPGGQERLPPAKGVSESSKGETT